MKVFHPFYGDTAIVKESDEEGKIIMTEFTEPFVKYLYKPLTRRITTLSEKIGKTQNGNIQTYFAYMLVTLVVALLAVRLL